MKVRLLILKLEGNHIESSDIPKIRGYIAGRFPQYIELHNHYETDKFKYGYPMVQYKIIGSTPAIIAINSAIRILTDIFYDIDEIDIRNKMLLVMEKGYSIKQVEIGQIEDMCEYRFASPWLALNQQNYKAYISEDSNAKMGLLKKILIGNVLSLSKYMDYHVKHTLESELQMEPLMVKFKSQSMLAFKGSFKLNFRIPDYLGIGKAVSRGFGTVIKGI